MKTTENQKTDGSIGLILQSKAKHGFLPSTGFYNTVGIRRKRWGQLVRNQVSPTLDELKSICSYFEADIKEFI
ncbi:MAG: hypothetical protein IPG89_05795 [Bacteroidetes bacterium]|nr:hypothetical protein [Bacteroidota bacterium]